jgi:hypothetical protein
MAANLDWLGLLQVTLLEGHNLVLTMRFAWKLLDQDHLLHRIRYRGCGSGISMLQYPAAFKRLNPGSLITNIFSRKVGYISPSETLKVLAWL